MKLRTGNRRRRAAHRAKVLQEAFDFDTRQGNRIAAMRQRHNSGFVRRRKARAKALRKSLRGA
jgi:hypothetical protein